MIDSTSEIENDGRFASFFRKRFSRNNVRFYCLVILAINIALVGARFVTNKNGETAFGYPVGRDFTAFYVAGRIANEYSFRSAYDFDLQSRLYHQMLPLEPQDAQLPYVNPPFLLPLFAALAYLPYALAFAIWLIISLALYCVGIGLLMQKTVSLPRETRSLVFAVALAFPPFITYCWGLGQLSAIGVCILAAAIALESDRRRFLCGLVLSGCCYKPTLLVLLLPMLAITGRFRSMLGVFAGAILLGALSWFLVGTDGLREYSQAVRAFGQWKGTSSTISQTALYLDIRTAFKLISDSHPWLRIVIAGIYSVFSAILVWCWWRLGLRTIAWGLTITWSLVLNFYTPLYDASLLVIPVLLLLDRLYEIRGKRLPTELSIILVLLFILPLGYPIFAESFGFQVYTILIICFGIYQFREYWPGIGNASVEVNSHKSNTA